MRGVFVAGSVLTCCCLDVWSMLQVEYSAVLVD